MDTDAWHELMSLLVTALVSVAVEWLRRRLDADSRPQEPRRDAGTPEATS